MTATGSQSLLAASPIKPMLAKPSPRSITEDAARGQVLVYEPKWDGFRCLIFKGPDEVRVQGRSGDDLTYCFPEMVEACKSLPPGTILDGELVIVHNGRLQFEQLGQRIRPRSEAGGWKITELSEQHPTDFVAFDMLRSSKTDLMDCPFADRRRELEQLDLQPPLHLTPATREPETAEIWFDRFEGAGLDGVIGKDLSAAYQPGKRTMLKYKHVRSADVVVAGWRAHKVPGPDGSSVVGSLLLGLYNNGLLHHVGVASSFSAKKRLELAEFLAPLALTSDGDHPWRAAGSNDDPHQRVPGGKSRWTGKKDLSFQLVEPNQVAEVKYDQMEGSRFRHVTTLLRFRPDREADSCTYDQLDSPTPMELTEVIPSLSR